VDKERLGMVSPRLGESVWGMGGTLVSDECHLFNMEITEYRQ